MSLPFKSLSKVREFELPSGKIVSLKPLDGYCEDVLSSDVDKKNKGKKGIGKQQIDSFDMVIHHCIESLNGVKPNIEELDSMLLGDRFFIMVALRLISVGELLEVQHVCPNCKATNNFDVDVEEDILNNSKTIKNLVEKEKINFENLLKTVEVDGICFVLKQMTSKDQKILQTRLDGSNNSLANTYSLMACVKGWYEKKKNQKDNEILPLNVSLAQSMPFKQSQQLKEEISKFTIGPDLRCETECLNCSSELIFSLLTPNFFKLATQSQNSPISGKVNAEQPIQN